MLAGVLKGRVELQQKEVTQGPLGQSVTWRPVGEYYARVIPLDVKAIAQYMQLNTVATHRIILRGKVEVNLGSHRLLYHDKVFQPQQSAKYANGISEIICKEVE